MDSSFDLSDPSDWLNTSVVQLGTVEAALRCQVCKDFFDTPMITSCSHTFCSLCIRRCITNDGRCPTCRAQEQEMKLRPNSIVQEIVDEFREARPTILQLGHDVRATRDSNERSGKKRKLADADMEEIFQMGRNDLGRRNTRLQSQRRSASHDQDDEQNIDRGKSTRPQPDDGLTACPICSERMKEEAVFAHLDVHNKPESSFTKQPETAKLANLSDAPIFVLKSPGRPNSFNRTPSARQPSKFVERLPQLNYSLLKEVALRKKLSELGIPNAGPKTLLIRRHTEWVNLVNANCDSLRPRSKRELLHELDIWDKTQGRQILNNSGSLGGASVMNKDFDGPAWAATHDNDFQALIAKARTKAKPRTEIGNSSDEGETPTPSHLEEDSQVSHEPGNSFQKNPDQASLSLRDASQPMRPPRQSSFVDLEVGD